MTYTVRYASYAGETAYRVTPRSVGRVVNEFLRKAEPGETVSVSVDQEYESAEAKR